MDFLYFLVTSAAEYGDKFGFYRSYFSDGGAFGEGTLYSVIIGVAIALVFYFVLCNGSSVKPATHVNWGLGLLLAALVAYLVGDFMIIGTDGVPGTGLFAHCQDFAREFMQKNNGNEQALNECQTELNNIIASIRQGNEVTLMFNVTNVVIAALAYFLTSVGVKNFTTHGSQIPF